MSRRLEAVESAAEAAMSLVEVPCPRCSCTRSHPVASGRDYLYGVPGSFTAAECADCGLRFQNPRPPLSRAHELYPADYLPHQAPATPPARPVSFYRRAVDAVQSVHRATELAYPSGTATHAARFAARLLRGALRQQAGEQLIPRYVEHGSVLELGCGAGDRLATLRSLGWKRLVGIDIVPDAVREAREKGFEVLCGEATEQLAALPDASFDVVVASMVLEHLPSPFEVIAAIARKLKPGGELLFSTIVCDSWDAARFGGYWAGYDFPRHFVFLSRADVRRAVDEGFTGLEEFAQNAPIDFVRSATWRAPEQRVEDRLITRAPDLVLRALGFWVARSGRSTRVSFRCFRK